MSNFPVRGVGGAGIITDQSPYDLDLNAWSSGRNVRFAGGSVSRYSVFKDAFPSIDFAVTVPAEQQIVGGGIFRTPGVETPFTVHADFSINDWAGSLVDATPVDASFTPPVSTTRCSTAFIGGVSYLNRSDWRPLVRTPGDATWAHMASWPADDRCFTLRPFKDFLIALNVTKSGSSSPAMIKWSDAIQYGTVASWAFGPSAPGEAPQNDATSGFRDGLALGDLFIAYTETEVYRVEYIGGDFVFGFRKIFNDDGIMWLNCAVEVEGKHFVFGSQDIYVHDAITKKSITDRLIKEYLFSIIDFSKRDRCFVTHDAEMSEVIFAFPSLLDGPGKGASEDCDMAAVYNYVDGTWSFVDLPNVADSVRVPVNQPQTWDSLSSTWTETGASWLAQSGSLARITTMFANGSDRNRIVVLDTAYAGRSSAPIVSALSYPSYVERVGLDMDNIGAELAGRKMLRRLVPQMETGADTLVSIELGRSRYSGSPVVWEFARTFNPATQYKVDSRNTGRYLAMRISVSGSQYFKLSGYDLELIQISRR